VLIVVCGQFSSLCRNVPADGATGIGTSQEACSLVAVPQFLRLPRRWREILNSGTIISFIVAVTAFERLHVVHRGCDVKSKEFGKAPSSGLQPTRLGRATGITAIWGIWCCFIQPGRAQVARPSASSNSASNAKTARSVYITEPIDPGLSALPANFQGHDIETIYKFLQASKGAEPKSEFETTEHYNQRQDASAVQPILGTLTASSIFGFVLSEASAFAGELSIKYDADDGKMTIILDPQVKTLYLERDNPEVEIISIKTNEISHDTYTGSNAFGATRLITRSYLESY